MAKVVCTSCGYVGEPTTITKGSFGIELFLWLLLLVPGLIYSLWRLSTRYEGCPVCRHATLIPAASPMAKKFLRDNLPEQAAQAEELVPRPSETAQAAGRALGRLVRRILK